MECDIFYVESQAILKKFKDKDSFFIVTKKGEKDLLKFIGEQGYL